MFGISAAKEFTRGGLLEQIDTRASTELVAHVSEPTWGDVPFDFSLGGENTLE